MDTKEAIRVFKELIKKKTLFRLMDSEVNFYEKVIEFLQEGRHYKEMWEDLEIEGKASESFGEHLKYIKQKYFPKVVKWDINI